MPKSPQEWPFPNRTKLGLDKDTLGFDCFEPCSSLLNGHGRVNYPCESQSILIKGHSCVVYQCKEVQAVLISHVGLFSSFSARFSLFLLFYAYLSIKHEFKGLGASNSPNIR